MTFGADDKDLQRVANHTSPAHFFPLCWRLLERAFPTGLSHTRGWVSEGLRTPSERLRLDSRRLFQIVQSRKSNCSCFSYDHLSGDVMLKGCALLCADEASPLKWAEHWEAATKDGKKYKPQMYSDIRI